MDTIRKSKGTRNYLPVSFYVSKYVQKYYLLKDVSPG